MKKRFIILVVAAIFISLMGLLGIQLYWIRNAATIKELNFDHSVNEASSNAIYKFNKEELTRRMMRHQEQSQHMNHLVRMMDSLNQAYYEDIFIRQGQSAPGSLQQESIWDYLSGADNDYPVSNHDTIGYHAGRNHRSDNSNGYLPSSSQSTQQDPFISFFERSRIIYDLVEDLFSGSYTFQVSNEHSIASLDSLLTHELNSQGIKTPFEFGIYDPVAHSLVREKTGRHSLELMQSPYAFHLFPNDIFMNPEYLLLHFPQQERYILSQMNTMLGASIVLILIIISSFGFTIFSIIRQKKLSAMKNDFINNMTHELKTPISTISLACQALSDQDIHKSKSLYDNYIHVINEENERLGMLTEKVLQTALIEKARIRLNMTGTDIHELVESAIAKVGLQVEARHGKIEQRLNAAYSYVLADKIHMTNLFTNLLDNANKYSPNKPVITVTTENNAEGVLVHVEDKGVGISRQNQKKIFENLYRVSTGNIHDVKGFGLGLSYVKAIAEKHQGYVSLESESNKGSIFTVFIPFGYSGREDNTPDNTII